MGEEEVEEDFLERSWKALGALDPVKVDAHGNVIDGFHRRALDPKWPTLKIEHIVDPVQLSMARLVINVCRRQVTPEEKTKLLSDIAGLTGWTPKEIAKATGMSERWVRKYLPADLKREYSARRAELVKPVTPVTPVEPKPQVIDTGFVFVCPECNAHLLIMHVPPDKHRFEPVHVEEEAEEP